MGAPHLAHCAQGMSMEAGNPGFSATIWRHIPIRFELTARQ